MNAISPERRRQAVARLLRRGRIGTQEELLSALSSAGFRATQATLSRDLAQLGARGFKIHPNTDGLDAAHPAYRAMFQVADSHGLFVILHTGKFTTAVFDIWPIDGRGHW